MHRGGIAPEILETQVAMEAARKRAHAFHQAEARRDFAQLRLGLERMHVAATCNVAALEQLAVPAQNGAAVAHGKPNELEAAIDVTLRRYAEFSNLQGAFGRRATIEQAKGILMARNEVGADEAFAMLRQASEAVIATLPAENRAPALMVGLHIWSLAHGIASLFARGDAARRRLPMSPEELLEAGVLVYLRGLGVRV